MQLVVMVMVVVVLVVMTITESIVWTAGVASRSRLEPHINI